MHYTLHLTDACSMACRYCYVRQDKHFMSEETARAAVDLAAQNGGHHGIIFFGGEPLLCRELIYRTVEYAESVQKKSAVPLRFHYKITTNGLALDDEFLDYSVKHEIFIALSHDGVRAAHDANRITRDGSGTFERLEPVAKALLERHSYAPVMMTVAPNTVRYYHDSVKYLLSLGFKYIICSLDYAGDWSEEGLRELERQYKLLAALYRELTLAEEKFYLSPFEVKISSHIHRANYCAERCELGKKQVSVAPDGRIYPCVQFADEDEYCIGNVTDGIDESRRHALYLLNEKERDTCAGCAVRQRCNHYCACLNKQATGDMRRVSPVLCANERILIPIADRLAESLYRDRSAMFIQKQYNDMFPIISLTEDKLKPAP